MIDIHSHILAGVDDGSIDMDSTIKMAQIAVADGITTMIATPHHMNGTYINHKEDVSTKVDELNRLLTSRGIPLTVLPSQEIRIYEGLLEDLEKQKLFTLDPNGQYILLELPSQSVPHYLERLVFDIQVKGITPIIPHPERNSAIRENPNLLYRVVKAGALAQLTAASLTGKFGKTIERFSRDLIEHRLVHMIASDAHDTDVRAPRLAEAYQVLDQIGGVRLVDEWKRNAEQIAIGKRIWVDEPLRIQKKKFFGIF